MKINEIVVNAKSHATIDWISYRDPETEEMVVIDCTKEKPVGEANGKE